ncbi:ankyrin repeat domain-containing protein [Legionella drozanskii]|uniref:ankyrin repeat domain-containing protein n=1 Tax=Legionella drozanskii TaxID=96228 RepID=UPI00104121C1|nr:ankyrin repeat domain-containing protein [Legionella drozanskii]
MYEKTEQEETNEEAKILSLPDELLIKVISHLHPHDILNSLKLVSPKFYTLSHEIAFWRMVFRREENPSLWSASYFWVSSGYLESWLNRIINWAIRNKSQNILDSFYHWVVVTRYNKWKEKDKTCDSKGRTQNHWAAICNQLAEFRKADQLLIDSRDNANRTALVIAAQHGHLELVNEILAKIDEDNVTARSKAWTIEKNRALKSATRQGHFDIIEVLLNHGAKIEDPPQTALIIAVEKSDYDMVDFLLKKGADVNMGRGENGETALMLAVSNGHVEIVRLLLKKGANANHVTYDHQTALMAAVILDQVEMIKIIFEETNIDLRTMALFMAVSWKKSEMVRFFVENTAHEDAIGSNIFEELLLDTALTRPSMVLPLLAGVNFNSDTISSTLETLLTIAILHWDDLSETSEEANRYFDLIEILNNHGAKIEAINDSKQAALRHLIAHIGKIYAMAEHKFFSLHFDYVNIYDQYLKEIKFLLEKGADINTPFRGKKTALMHAAQGGHLKLVELLLEKGANVNATDDENNTALISAAEEGHVQIVALLLKSGVSHAQKAEALARATINRQLDVVNLLQVEMVSRATVDYLNWRETEAPGHRLLNRFTHWYHGTNGIKRTENILHSINSGVSPTQLMQEVKSAVEDSSHRKHSYSRYIFDVFKAPPTSTVNNQSDEEFLELKKEFLANYDQQFLSV